MANQYELDAGNTFQTIDHFGASGAWSLDPIGSMWTEDSKNIIADLLFSVDQGIGLSGWRFAIGSGGAADGTEYPEPLQWRSHTDTFRKRANSAYDWHTHEGQRWFMKAAKARGVEQFIAMAYSPPAWMTKNGKITPDASAGQSNLADERIGEFAQYLADIVQHFTEDGMPFDYISPVNEPSWSWDDSKQEGNRYTNDQIKSIVRALHEELRKRNLPVKIDIAEAAEIAAMLDDKDVQTFLPHLPYYQGHVDTAHYDGKYREYVKDFLGDAAFSPLVDHKLSYHAYWADHADQEDRLITYRQHLRDAINRYCPGAKLWQTEYCNLNKNGPGRDLGMDMALFMARVIHYDLTVAQATAWNWWLAVSPHDYKDGLIYTDFARSGDAETIWSSKMLWTLGHFSRFVRPGAVRVALTGVDNKEGLMASAYIHEAHRTLSVVFINYGEHDEDVEFICKEFPVSLSKYITSDREGDDLRNFGEGFSGGVLTVPGRSILTLHGGI